MRYVVSDAAKLRAMITPRRSTVVVSAALAALLLMVGPALATDVDLTAALDLAVEEPPADEAPATGDDDHRIGLVDTPRDRFGLLMLVVLLVGGGAALINARRQLKGEREQATGEFRWR